MLTRYTKERLSRPSLSVVEESQQFKEIQLSALEKLKTLKPDELHLEDDDSDSDLSDPLEDLKDNVERGLQKAKKKLSRLERSLQLMDSFSQDFKKAMEETREELKLDSKIYYDDIDQITETLKQSALSKNLTKAMEEQLNKIFEDTDNLNIPDHDPAENSPKSEPECDVMSGVWNMLATSKNLIATPPFYNAYRQQSNHWLDREDIHWETMDEAKEKCVTWLKDHEDDDDEDE